MSNNLEANNPVRKVASRHSLVVTEDDGEIQGSYPLPNAEYDYDNHLDNKSTEFLKQASEGHLNQNDGLFAGQIRNQDGQ